MRRVHAVERQDRAEHRVPGAGEQVMDREIVSPAGQRFPGPPAPEHVRAEGPLHHGRYQLVRVHSPRLPGADQLRPAQRTTTVQRGQTHVLSLGSCPSGREIGGWQGRAGPCAGIYSPDGGSRVSPSSYPPSW